MKRFRFAPVSSAALETLFATRKTSPRRPEAGDATGKSRPAERVLVAGAAAGEEGLAAALEVRAQRRVGAPAALHERALADSGADLVAEPAGVGEVAVETDAAQIVVALAERRHVRGERLQIG